MGRDSDGLGMGRSWLSVGLDLRVGLGLERERVDRSSDLRTEHVVDEAVLLDAGTPLERLGGDRRAEVVATAGVVLDLGVSPRDGGFDALLDFLGGWHDVPSVE